MTPKAFVSDLVSEFTKISPPLLIDPSSLLLSTRMGLRQAFLLFPTSCLQMFSFSQVSADVHE